MPTPSATGGFLETTGASPMLILTQSVDLISTANIAQLIPVEGLTQTLPQAVVTGEI